MTVPVSSCRANFIGTVRTIYIGFELKILVNQYQLSFTGILYCKKLKVYKKEKNVTNILSYFSLFLTDSLRIFVSWRGITGVVESFFGGIMPYY